LTLSLACNVFGQISLFWSKIAPYNSKEGIGKGMIVGMRLWIVLFVPLGTNLEYNHALIPLHFQRLINISITLLLILKDSIPLLFLGGSLLFHLIYGALAGFISGRMGHL
jgi:hypothetical protein